jgi:eukaryotic-like serine/threonine-protein kinase
MRYWPTLKVATVSELGSPVMFVILKVQSGSNSGQRFRITPGQQVLVGRKSPADITCPTDRFVSSAHFSLENDAEKCWITDLNSRNGTFVNEQKVQRIALSDGDTVRAGLTIFAVRMKADDARDSSTSGNVVALPGPIC